MEDPSERASKRAHYLIVELCWSLRHKAYANKMAHTAKEIFHDDEASLTAYQEHAVWAKAHHMAALSACFAYAKLPDPA